MWSMCSGQATQMLDLVHGDICRPMQRPTKSGARYFLLLLMISLGRCGFISFRGNLMYLRI
jgi:hypothetical protein